MTYPARLLARTSARLSPCMMAVCTLMLALPLAGCGMNEYAKNSLARKNITVDAQKPVPHCYGYGCAKRVDIGLTGEDWMRVGAIMTPAPRNAAEERDKIKAAVALFEQIMGERAQTGTDKSGTFRHMNAPGNQQDCVDESLNTTIYLTLLSQKNLLVFHSIEGPTVRLPLIHAGGWPHQTATITETASGQVYAVDSWFHDNGYPPEIIPMEEWKDGWKPQKILQNQG